MWGKSPCGKSYKKPISAQVNHSGLNISAWEEELEFDFDKEYLLKGVKYGFDLIDDGINVNDIQQCEMDNYTSATNVKVKCKVEDQINIEIQEGNYVITKDKPKILSAIGTVPKPHSSDIRIIHDCSRPLGHSLNNYASIEKTKYQSVDDAVKMSTKNCYYAKIDLKSAYRSVKIHPSNFELTGLKWQFKGDKEPTYLYDSKLPFGARKSPFIFHKLTQSVRRMMSRRGFSSVVVYLDDFLVFGDNFEECKLAFNTLLKLLRKLGFYINWKKSCRSITAYYLFRNRS